MKLTVATLRHIIKEAIVMPPDVEEVLTAMVTSVSNGENDVSQRVVVVGRPHTVRFSTGPEGYEGRVDYDLFGTGKRPATAMNAIRKRLQFLTTDVDPRSKRDPGAVSRDDWDELKRREKLDRERWGKR